MSAVGPARMTGIGTRATTREPRLLVLDRPTCLALLATRGVGRLAYSHRALPAVLPLNYLADGDGVLVRLRAGSGALTAIRDAVVAFQVDDIDSAARLGWSVTLVGTARAVTDPVERQQVMGSPLVCWAGDDRDVFVRIAAERVTGRRLLTG